MTGQERPTWPLSRILGVTVALIILFSLAAVAVGGLALVNLHSERQRVETVIDPAALEAEQLYSALLNQETGVRGYALSSGNAAFLAPYTQGHAAEMTLVTQLRKLLPQLPATSATALNTTLAQARDWRIRYAMPEINEIKAKSGGGSSNILAGKAEFDDLRTKFAVFQADVSSSRMQAQHSLNQASDELDVSLFAIAIGLVVAVILLALVLRATAIRPVHVLAAEARRVAAGDFEHEVAQAGPREISGLAADMNVMRLRILQEVSTVREANDSLASYAANLQRSNAELEQFAYVASHDLQEPLRKVTSFCQLLQRRYGGQLDEKADQYIDFAVDGAKRMQVLINDLLSFSRVGRSDQQLGPVALAEALADAQANLATQIAAADAVVEATGPLPVVRGQLALLTALLQNLIGNALKFRGGEPPRITVTAERQGANWLLSVSDNGIGIEPQYAERVFLIFQRLHDRATYPGTGIGLAMGRKIVEYFGGRIWLDTEVAAGARFYFTLPVLKDEGTDG